MAGMLVAFAGVFLMGLTASAEASPSRWKRDAPAYGSLYQKEIRGSENTEDFRVFARDKDGRAISFWHDIPFFNDESNKIYNMVIEIPKWTNARREISYVDPLSPIRQLKLENGELEFDPNIYPFHGYIRNHGTIPQTWLDPNFIVPETGLKGDNGSIDIFEIGDRIGEPGDVIPVKLLGALAVVEGGMTDWKFIAIDTRDRVADQINDIDDVERVKPGLLDHLRKWIGVLKTPLTGKPPSELGLGGRYLGKDEAEKALGETHRLWRGLVESSQSPQPAYARQAVLYPGAQEKLSQAEAEAIVKAAPELGPPAPLDNVKLGRSYYILE